MRYKILFRSNMHEKWKQTSWFTSAWHMKEFLEKLEEIKDIEIKLIREELKGEPNA